MKKVILILFFLPLAAIAQVGVGTTNPNASLDIRSSNQATPANTDGLLIPKIDEFPATLPTGAQNGMLVFVTGAGTPSRGFYYWNFGSLSWIPLQNIERINDLIDGKSDVDGSEDGSSVYLGINAGANDDSSDNKNVAIGFQALEDVDGSANNEGDNNVAIGYYSLRQNTTGRRNTSIGHLSMAQNLTGNNNTAIGGQALQSNTTGSSNISIGAFSSSNNTTGINNVTMGNQSMRYNVTGNGNTALGDYALKGSLDDVSPVNGSGAFNVAIGSQALEALETGDNNTAVGYESGNSITSGANNVALGYQAANSLVDGNENVVIGREAGNSITDDSGNVFIGYQAGFNESNSDRLYIENSNAGQNGALIWGRFDNDILRVNGTFQISNPGNNGYAFPTDDGTADQILVTDGNGQLTFEDQAPDVSTFPIIRANMTTNQALAATGWQKIAFNTVTLNPTTSTEFDTANNRFVAANAGTYRIDASFHSLNAQANTQYYGIAVYIGGTLYQEFSINHYYNGTTSSQVARQISCVANVTAGQAIEIYVNNNQTGVTLDAFNGKTHFTIERIR